MFPIKKVSRIEMAFPAHVADMMPSYEECKDMHHTPWAKTASTWFFSGINIKSAKPKEGVNQDEALAHIKCILGSWEPKHEHKEAAVAYLLREWFDEFEVEPAK